MAYKWLKDWNSGFHDWVLNRHPGDSNRQNGFMGGFIYGHKGNGKSTYCYKVMAKIYYTVNGFYKKDDEETAYNISLEHMFLDGDEYLDHIITNRVLGIITPVLCLDDASMHFGTQLYKHNPGLYDAMAGEMATVRSAVTGFLVTSPKRSMCAKFLRDNDDYKGEALIVDDWERKIRFYEWREYPDERKFKIQIPFQDRYSCYIPDLKVMGIPCYENYIKKKRYYELKHDIMIADKHRPQNRKIFISLLEKYPERVPQEFHSIIKKWDQKNIIDNI